MKTKLHLFFYAILFSIGLHAQTVTVTSTLPGTIETGDELTFDVDYTTDAKTYTLIVRYYESDGTTRYGSDQDAKSIPASTTSSETLSIDAPLVAGDYVAKVFIEEPGPSYAKTYAPDISFTVTAKVVSVKADYLFDTDADAEGWEVETTGGGGTPTATVASGILTLGRGTTTWGTTYLEQKTYKLDPSIHTYIHITYKKTAWSLNNEIVLDWITSGTTRSSSNGALVTISTNGMSDYETVTYNLGGNAEWTSAEATSFRLYVREQKGDNSGSTKSGDILIDSIVFNNGVSLSTGDVNAIDGLTVSPNPFTDSFTYTTDLSEPVIVELFSIDGSKVATIKNSNGIVNTESLSSGVYFARFTSGDVQEVKKLIKN